MSTRVPAAEPAEKGAGWRRKGSWGHLLNEHYLFDIADYLDGITQNPYPPVDPKDPEPRLYGYFAGGRPDGGEGRSSA